MKVKFFYNLKKIRAKHFWTENHHTRKKTNNNINNEMHFEEKIRDLIKVEFASWKEQQQVNCETNKKKFNLPTWVSLVFV